MTGQLLPQPAEISEEMRGGYKGTGGDRGDNEITCNDVYDGSSGRAPVWEKNMVGYGCNNDGARGISSQDCKTDCGNDSKEGQRWGMRVVTSGLSIGYHRALEDKGVFEGATGNNRGVCSRETHIQNLFCHIVDGGFQ